MQLPPELTAAAGRDLPYDITVGGYRSVWHDADHIDRERVDAVSPALRRHLDTYTDALDRLNKVRDEITEHGDVLSWGLPDLVETYTDHPYRPTWERYRFVLSRHPTRDRTVIYDPVGRFVERFEDGFRDAAHPTALRSRLLGKSIANDWSYRRHLRRWDDTSPGWHEVLWAWMEAEGIRELLVDREQVYETGVDAAYDAKDYLERPHVARVLDD